MKLIELPVPELKTALTGLSKVVLRSTGLPALQTIRVTRDNDGCVTLQATDLDVFVTYQAKDKQPGPICDFLVPFEPLHKAVKGRIDGLQIVSEANNLIRFKTSLGGSVMEQTLESVPVEEFPIQPRITEKPTPVDASFRDAVRHALDCCGEDATRPAIQHACVDITDPKAHYVVGTNGSHLYCANSFTFDLPHSILVPDLAFMRWTGFMEDGNGQLSIKSKGPEVTGKKSKKVEPEPGWMQLRSGQWVLIAKQADHPYPNWKGVLSDGKGARTTVLLQTPAVKMLLAGIPKLPGADCPSQPLLLEIGTNQMLVKARARNAADWTVLQINDVITTIRPVSISINREYLLRGLRYGLTTLEIVDDRSPCELSEGGKRMVISQINPASPPPPPTTPPAQPSEAKPQETTSMPKATIPAESTTLESPIKVVLQKIDQIKEGLKQVLRDLSDTTDQLKAVEKDKKVTDKEIESIREKLRALQAVKI